MPTFTLSIDLFATDSPLDQVDIAQALRRVADRLVKFTSLPWSPYALSGEVYAADSDGEIRAADGSRKAIGSWAVETAMTRAVKQAISKTVTAKKSTKRKAVRS